MLRFFWFSKKIHVLIFFSKLCPTRRFCSYFFFSKHGIFGFVLSIFCTCCLKNDGKQKCQIFSFWARPDLGISVLRPSLLYWGGGLFLQRRASLVLWSLPPARDNRRQLQNGFLKNVSLRCCCPHHYRHPRSWRSFSFEQHQGTPLGAVLVVFLWKFIANMPKYNKIHTKYIQNVYNTHKMAA